MAAPLTTPTPPGPPAALPSPPFLEAAFLESPWTIVFVLLLSAVVAYFVLRLRAPRAAIAVVVACVLIAASAIVLSGLVVTERERLVLHSRSLVQLVADADGDAAGGWLTEEVELVVLGQPANRRKADLVDRVNADMAGRYALKNHAAKVTSTQASIDDAGLARTRFHVAVTPQTTDAPLGSWWVLHWRKRGEQWRVARIEMAELDFWPDSGGAPP